MSTRPAPELVLATSPYVHEGARTPRIMLEVLLAALLVVAWAGWHFGAGALLVVAAATAGAVGAEWLFGRHAASLRDWSAVLTGVLLGLTLPPGIALWMALLGGAVAILLGKVIWGGLGHNVFNPALVGRAFLQAAFPTAITTWVPSPDSFWSMPASLFAPPLMKAQADFVTTATPLGMMKFDKVATDPWALFLGDVPGSAGETSALLLVVLGVIMARRRLFDWRLPVATVLSVAAFSGVLWLVDPARFPTPVFMVLSGSLLFASVFMVTDPVSTPTTPRGAWIFGLGVGFLVVLIRLFGGLPEGVMYAILLMNALSPHLEAHTQPRPFGSRRRKGRAP